MPSLGINSLKLPKRQTWQLIGNTHYIAIFFRFEWSLLFWYKVLKSLVGRVTFLHEQDLAVWALQRVVVATCTSGCKEGVFIVLNKNFTDCIYVYITASNLPAFMVLFRCFTCSKHTLFTLIRSDSQLLIQTKDTVC